MVQTDDLLYLSRADFEAVCPDDAVVMEAVKQGVLAFADGQAIAQPTVGMSLPDASGGLYTIRGALTERGLMSVKSVGAFPDNRAAGLPPDAGVMLLHDGRTGVPRAILEGSFITTLRTAAMTALAAVTLARPGASVLACIGGRGIAPLAARMVRDALAITEIRVTSASQASREAAAAGLAGNGATAMATETWGDCIDGADIVLDGPGLGSHQPLLPSDRLAPGVTLVSYGAYSSYDDGILDAVDRIVLDRWADGGSGPLGPFASAGRFAESDVDGWFAEIVAGRAPARTGDNERLLAWTRGLGACDITLAESLIERARALGRGTALPYP